MKKRSKDNQATLGPIQRFLNNPKYQKFDLRVPRERSKEEIETGALLYQNLHAAFLGVDRNGGISLHETYGKDLYGDAAELAALRRLDTDKSWQEVQLEWIENFSGVGGLHFLNDIGLRYYTPAYFRWYLERDHLSESMITDTLIYSFTWGEIDGYEPKGQTAERLKVFSPSQAGMIQEFLEFVLKYNPDQAFLNTERINSSISKFWSKFGN